MILVTIGPGSGVEGADTSRRRPCPPLPGTGLENRVIHDKGSALVIFFWGGGSFLFYRKNT